VVGECSGVDADAVAAAALCWLPRAPVSGY